MLTPINVKVLQQNNSVYEEREVRPIIKHAFLQFEKWIRLAKE